MHPENAEPGISKNMSGLALQPASAVELSKDQEQELKDQLTQFKHDSAPLGHVLSLYGDFY